MGLMEAEVVMATTAASPSTPLIPLTPPIKARAEMNGPDASVTAVNGSVNVRENRIRHSACARVSSKPVTASDGSIRQKETVLHSADQISAPKQIGSPL